MWAVAGTNPLPSNLGSPLPRRLAASAVARRDSITELPSTTQGHRAPNIPPPAGLNSAPPGTFTVPTANIPLPAGVNSAPPMPTSDLPPLANPPPLATASTEPEL
ncbi:hypothetical protein MVEN_02240700 [Mycena venus]|uniref:Uncharacterized protein n=1 Tax=Mycena venus TaxID=2733690 RepID=A0A8H6X6C8_9AGAR|nr:hypothetical protein MVEN_02240700 [Mycena venus]